MIAQILILAQEVAGKVGEAGKEAAEVVAKKPKAAPWYIQFGPLIFMGLLFYFILLRPGMNERKKQAAAVSALKKNDRIVTVGGIIGTVADASEGDLITIKVDDGTRMKFRRSAVQGLYQEPEEKK